MDSCADETPHGPDAPQIGQALVAFLMWAADHADEQEQGALRALVDRRFRHDQLQLVRRLCKRYPETLRARLAKFLTS
jgi:hypothetical protein